METKWLNQITYFSVAPWSAVPTTARSGEREGDLNVELRGGEARNDDVERPCRRISWIARSLPTDSNFSYKILHYCRVSEQKKCFIFYFGDYHNSLQRVLFSCSVFQFSSHIYDNGYFFKCNSKFTKCRKEIRNHFFFF